MSLTAEDVRKASRAAYDAGTLTAQAPDATDRICKYEHKCRDGVVRTCAVGAALTQVQRDELRRCYALGGAVNVGPSRTIIQPKEDEATAIATLQIRHDSWANSNTAPQRERFRREFLRAIHHPQAEVV